MTTTDENDLPRYQQIAAALRAQIRDGTYPPGAPLPSEADLNARYSVSRGTTRQALTVLEREGLAVSVPGKGMFVPRLLPVLRMGHSRFSRAARRDGKGALAAEAEALGLSWRSESLGSETLTVAPHIAEVLGEPRAAVHRRRMWVGGIPTQLADSYIPASIDDVIGWSRGENAPGGIYGLLERHGHLITDFREELMARTATVEEAQALSIPAGAAVVTLVRHAIDHTGIVVEYFDSVAVGACHRYVYEFAAPED